MRLSDLFTGGQVNQSNAQVQQTAPAASAANAAQTARQLASLQAGQTVQGEVVGKNGSEVQIKMAGDMLINARLDQNMQLDIGKIMTFEVRNNGQSLLLSPLFANTAADANVLKALDMAGMPANQTTVSMTGMMMEAGLAIDRNSLQQIYREVNAFRSSSLSDIIDLHKLGLAVNPENLEQVASYKNLTHQLINGMNDVLEALPEAIQGMIQEGNVEGAAESFVELLEMVQELPQEEAAVAADAALTDGTVLVQGEEESESTGLVNNPEAVPEGNRAPGQADAGGVTQSNAMPGSEAQDVAGQTVPAMSQTVSEETEIVLQQGQDPASAAKNAFHADGQTVQKDGSANGIQRPEAQLADIEEEAPQEQSVSRSLTRLIRENSADAGKYSGLLEELETASKDGDVVKQANVLQRIISQELQSHDRSLLHKTIADKDVQKFLTDGLSKLWTIEPEEVADREKVDKLYQRLDRQLKSLNNILEEGGQTGSRAFQAVDHMNRNLDFLNQLNQAYTYVQLPLRLQQGEAHGDLYVYTNKRSLAAKDGQISALLHLDMEHLGPVDVYVVMHAEKVNTRFFVQDDEMLDFLEEHMDLLTERLQKRGYNCDVAMQIKDQGEQPASGLQGLLSQEKAQPIVQYAFDMRA